MAKKTHRSNGSKSGRIALKNDRAIPSWAIRLRKMLNKQSLKQGDMDGFLQTNARAVENTLAGYGPDSDTPNLNCGVRMAINIPSAHIPAFCSASSIGDPKPYKNVYDLSGKASRKRDEVDRCIPLPSTVDYKNVYFGAAEMNGAGVRFYGDVCLILKPDALSSETGVLDRNSYDVLRSPVRETTKKLESHDRLLALKRYLRQWFGKWPGDVGVMAAIKALPHMLGRRHRITTGQINDALLTDEDYIEVLKVGSFSAGDLQEARLFSADVANEAWLAARTVNGPSPSSAELLFINQRARAVHALNGLGVNVRVVSTSGRTR